MDRFRPAFFVRCLLVVALFSASASAVAPPEQEHDLMVGLELAVEESGPARPWTIHVQNRDERAVTLVKDPRLLSFRVHVPGKKQPVECRLPDAMRPTAAEPERLRLLGPDESLRFRIDPRFYCFGEGDQATLVPGAVSEARYGWPEQTRSFWRGGRKETERLPSVPPYVAQFTPEPSRHRRFRRPEDRGYDFHHAAPPHNLNAPGLRELKPVKLSLGSEYSTWAQGRHERARAVDGLQLEVTRGSDSLSARGAEVTVRLRNNGSRTQHIYLRREMLSFYLLGPEGLSVCAADQEERAPDVGGFTTLKPGQDITLVSRLVEFCPNEVLDRPGFFLVGAELNAVDDGRDAGVTAFTGTIYTTKPKPVRVQKGELPFVHKDAPPRGIAFAPGGRVRPAVDRDAPGPPARGEESDDRID